MEGGPASGHRFCSVVVYELHYGAERAVNPMAERTKLHFFLAPFVSLPFDDACALRCAKIRRDVERIGVPIGPHDLQIAAVALEHNLTLVTHNIREFSRVGGLKLDDWEA
jgi:tRNA(fMet)-specific endonuclease VapC